MIENLKFLSNYERKKQINYYQKELIKRKKYNIIILNKGIKVARSKGVIDMSIEELYNKYLEMDFEEVNRIAHDYDNSTYEEMVAASIIVTDKQIAEGKTYNIKEAFERISNKING